MNVLIINAHQKYENFSEGTLNNALVDIINRAVRDGGGAVRNTVIEAGYDPAKEVAKHLWADLIILQSPVFWFQCPWIYKKYVDEVFTLGLGTGEMVANDGRTRADPARQYGTGGQMAGKKFMMSLTWNAPAEAFGDPDQALFAGKSVDDVFVGTSLNYKFCGVEVLPAFSFHDVRKDPDVENELKRFNAMLTTILG